MTQTAGPREAAIQQALTLLDLENVDPEEPDCGICLQSYRHPTPSASHNLPQDPRPQECPAELSCGHLFGHLCITEWLKISEICPKCKARILPFRPSERPRSTFNIVVQSWDESRTRYLDRLWDMAASSDSGTEVFDAAVEALIFIHDQTSHTVAPDPTLHFVASEIAVKPTLLSDERYQTARYYQLCRLARRIPNHTVLESLIREDLVNIATDAEKTTPSMEKTSVQLKIRSAVAMATLIPAATRTPPPKLPTRNLPSGDTHSPSPHTAVFIALILLGIVTMILNRLKAGARSRFPRNTQAQEHQQVTLTTDQDQLQGEQPIAQKPMVSQRALATSSSHPRRGLENMFGVSQILAGSNTDSDMLGPAAVVEGNFESVDQNLQGFLEHNIGNRHLGGYEAYARRKKREEEGYLVGF